MQLKKGSGSQNRLDPKSSPLRGEPCFQIIVASLTLKVISLRSQAFRLRRLPLLRRESAPRLPLQPILDIRFHPLLLSREGGNPRSAKFPNFPRKGSKNFTQYPVNGRK